MKISILTLGCKVNQYESSVIKGNLINNGHDIVSLSENPHYCIVNTCAVTAKSDYQSRQLIRRAIKSGAKVIVTGCYSTIMPNEIKSIKGIHCVIDNFNKYNIIKLLSNNNLSITYNFSCKSRPYIKIQDGCNYSCTYCIIPFVRGKSRSINVEDILRQINNFVLDGYTEIVLTGIHLGLFGYDLVPKTNLVSLIRSILKETKIKRIRLSSLEINEIDDEFIEILQDDRICKHLHIPLQSGDDKILKLMNRNYTTKGYVKVLNTVIKKISNIAIGTDIIVGFPGEGQNEFMNSLNLIESIPFSYIHIFPFSPRPGTVASRMKCHIPSATKKERVNILKDLNIKKKELYLKSQINKILDIIIEEQTTEQTSVGTSSNYLKVRLNSNKYLPKSLINVRINGIENDMLTGIPLE